MKENRNLKLLLIIILFFTWCSKPKINSQPAASESKGVSESRYMKKAIIPSSIGLNKKEMAEPKSNDPVNQDIKSIKCSIKRLNEIHKSKRKIQGVDVVFDGNGFAFAWIQGASGFFMKVSSEGEPVTEPLCVYDGSKKTSRPFFSWSREKVAGEFIKDEIALLWTGNEYALVAKMYYGNHPSCCAAVKFAEDNANALGEATHLIPDICTFKRPTHVSAWTGSHLIVAATKGYIARGIQVASYNPETKKILGPELVMKGEKERYFYLPCLIEWIDGKARVFVKRSTVETDYGSIFFTTFDENWKKLDQWKRIEKVRMDTPFLVIEDSIYMVKKIGKKKIGLAKYSLNGEKTGETGPIDLAAASSDWRTPTGEWGWAFWSGKWIWFLWLSKKSDLYALPLSLDGKKLSEPHHIPGKFNDVSFSVSGRPEENIFLLSGKKSVFVSYMECK